MKFDESQQIDVGQIDDRRGKGGGGFSGGGLGSSSGGGFPIPIGRAGGGGMILLFIAFMLLRSCMSSSSTSTLNPTSVGSGNIVNSQGQNTDLATECAAGTNWSEKQVCRDAAVVNSVQGYWSDILPRISDANYREAQTQFFTGSTSTGCGQASSAVGPFYCPRDEKVYLDLSFFDELTTTLGAEGGPFAEAYVIAHEYGHHVQNILGISGQVEAAGNETGPTSPGVRLELQADCFAGAWAHNATSGPNPIITELTQDDIRRAIDAAASVGDDRIQQKMQGRVTPESWTHGSAAARMRWFNTGFNSGEPAQCDTFNASNSQLT